VLSAVRGQSYTLIASNPPFHTGHANEGALRPSGYPAARPQLHDFTGNKVVSHTAPNDALQEINPHRPINIEAELTEYLCR
jgi:hypothetical protein